MALSENQALFRIGDVLLGTRLIDGNFPEYKRLLPTSFEREISVDREELMGTLRRVNLFAQRQTPPVPVSLSFSEGAVEVIVRNGEIGEAHEKLSGVERGRLQHLLQPRIFAGWGFGGRYGEGALQAQRVAKAGPDRTRLRRRQRRR